MNVFFILFLLLLLLLLSLFFFFLLFILVLLFLLSFFSFLLPRNGVITSPIQTFYIENTFKRYFEAAVWLVKLISWHVYNYYAKTTVGNVFTTYSAKSNLHFLKLLHFIGYEPKLKRKLQVLLILRFLFIVAMLISIYVKKH